MDRVYLRAMERIMRQPDRFPKAHRQIAWAARSAIRAHMFENVLSPDDLVKLGDLVGFDAVALTLEGLGDSEAVDLLNQIEPTTSAYPSPARARRRLVGLAGRKVEMTLREEVELAADAVIRAMSAPQEMLRSLRKHKAFDARRSPPSPAAG